MCVAPCDTRRQTLAALLELMRVDARPCGARPHQTGDGHDIAQCSLASHASPFASGRLTVSLNADDGDFMTALSETVWGISVASCVRRRTGHARGTGLARGEPGHRRRAAAFTKATVRWLLRPQLHAAAAARG